MHCKEKENHHTRLPILQMPPPSQARPFFLFLSFPQELICLITKANLYLIAVVVMVFHYQSPPPYLEIFFLKFIIRNSQFIEHCVNYIKVPLFCTAKRRTIATQECQGSRCHHLRLQSHSFFFFVFTTGVYLT